MIDGGKLYDWLERHDTGIIRWIFDDPGDKGYSARDVERDEFAELFRAYVAELTG